MVSRSACVIKRFLTVKDVLRTVTFDRLKLSYAQTQNINSSAEKQPAMKAQAHQ